ncbi:MAG: serine protease [Planctomycetota bacterium]
MDTLRPLPARRSEVLPRLVAVLLVGTAAIAPASRSDARDAAARLRERNVDATAAIFRQGERRPIGTGVLVAADQVLTCLHVTRVYAELPERVQATTLEVAFAWTGSDSSSPRVPVKAFRDLGPDLDATVLVLAAPVPQAPVPLARASVHEGQTVYVAHHAHGAPLDVTTPRRVLFPYRVTSDPASALPPNARASYRPQGDDLVFEGPRWGFHPTIGLAFDAPPGSSGAPVFDAVTHELVGIVYAHSRHRRSPDPWLSHGAALPIEVLALAR